MSRERERDLGGTQTLRNGIFVITLSVKTAPFFLSLSETDSSKERQGNEAHELIIREKNLRRYRTEYEDFKVVVM